MYIENRTIENPTFSICIPQYNRTSFLLEALKTLEEQEFQDFEVCISDDCSTDGRESEIIDFLKSSKMSFVYKRQEMNLRYDGNIRESIELASGKYCFLHGNDDCLSSKSTLKDLDLQIKKFGSPEVIITNFKEFDSGQVSKRAGRDRIFGKGPEIAANQFRNLAFVSGLILNTEKAHQIATNKWDGLEMYQMYIISRIIASGGTALGINLITIRKDLQIANEQVDAYSKNKVLDPCPIIERKITTVDYGRLVIDAVSDYLPDEKKDGVFFKIFLQIYMFTYPYWVFEHRRIQSWKFAVGVALGFRPKNVIGDVNLKSWTSFKLKSVYVVVTSICLLTPGTMFFSLHPLLYKISRLFFIRS